MHDREFEQTNAPVLRVAKKTIARRIVLDETDLKASQTLLTFDKRISVFVETESFTRMLINGVDTNGSDTSRYNDFHGYMSSFADPLEYARAKRKRLGLGRDSDTTIEVVMAFSQFGGIAFKREDVDTSRMLLYNDSIPYKPLPKDWIDVSTPSLRKRAETWLAADDIVAAIDAKAPFLNGMREELCQHVVFASNLTDDENLAMFGKVIDSSPVKLDQSQRDNLLTAYEGRLEAVA